MIAKYSEIAQFAQSQFNAANVAATCIQFSAEKYARNEERGSVRASLIQDEPEFAILDTFYGAVYHASILSVDLRGSSSRAVKIGAKDTYLTMHTFLPTMEHLVDLADGRIVGLRGDGLIAAFGLTKKDGSGNEWAEIGPESVRDAVRCGKAMIEATEEAISEVLTNNGVRGNLSAGVGVGVGEVVITRIGLRTANEVTAYGPAVNQASKLSGELTRVRLSKGAYDIYPTGKHGKLAFSHHGEGYIAQFPDDMFMLERDSFAQKRKQPK